MQKIPVVVSGRRINQGALIVLLVITVGGNLAQIALGIQFHPEPPEVDGNVTEERTIVSSDALVSSANRSLSLYRGSERVARWTKYDSYYDVDQVGPNTVEYTAVELDLSYCSDCLKNHHIRHNIRTNETTILRTSVETPDSSTEWHDVDRIDDNTHVYADMAEDEVYVYNSSSGLVEWGWELYPHRGPQTGYGITSGDWSHMNDVEVVRNGTQYMVSLRNQNEVIFVNRQNGTIVDSIGGNGTTVMFEQHNPDYIPEENGGPAVIVADSQNDRVVEYEKRDGSWVKTWEWRDRYMNWPRDADRLPNGHTLVTDTYTDRVMELDEDGDVIWSVKTPTPYEAERLGTGDESTGGPAASTLDIESQVTRQSHETFSSFLGPQSGSFVPGYFPWLDWWDFALFTATLVPLYIEGFFVFNKYLYEPYIEPYF